MKIRQLAIVVGALAAIGVLAACGSAQPAAKPVAADANQQAGQPAKTEQKPQVLKVASVDGFAPLVTNANGRTIYRFDEDKVKPPTSTCFDACAKTWQPVLAGADGVKIEGDVIKQPNVGTIDRPEGKQVTLKGWPLYYFKDDLKLGQTAGQGKNGTWFAVSPDGAKAARTDGTAEQAPAQPATGKKEQVLRIATVNGFMPFVTNDKGRTVYRFDKDTASPPKTTCFDACAKIWEPVLAGTDGFRIDSKSINPGDVGTIDRPEGKQLTLKGWPLYYFHKDLKLGQTAGHGVNNVWFAIAPDGTKAERCP